MRIRLLDALREAPATVQELQQATGASQQNVSKHLGLLLRSGLVSRQQGGQLLAAMRSPTRACSSCASTSAGACAASWTSSTRCCPGEQPMSATATALVPLRPRTAEPAHGTRRADRPPRPLHGDAFPHGAHRLAAGRGRARVLRAAGGDRPLRRGLGSERIAVGPGPQARRTGLRRPRQLRADDRRVLPD